MCLNCIMRGDLTGFDKTHDDQIRPIFTSIGISEAGIGQLPGTDTVAGNTTTTAAITVGGTVNGWVNTSGDQDWFRVDLVAGQAYTITLNGSGNPVLADPFLRIFDAAGNQVAFDDDSGPGYNSLLTFTAGTSGTFYLSAGGYGTNTGGYTLGINAGGAPALPVFTIDQIADQLQTGYWGGPAYRWAPTNTDITFNVQGLTAERAALARLAFQVWADVCGLTFTETVGAAEITLDDNQSGAFANFSTTNGFITHATVNVATNWFGGSSAMDSYTFQTFIHEIGHALGFGHGGNYNGSATYGVDNHYANDTWQYTIMSYFDQANFNGQSYRFVMTPMMADIAAAIEYYGGSNLRNGNTTYGFNSNAGVVYNFASYAQAPAYTIYDGGGVDTIDASGYGNNQVINLAGGSFSSIGGLIGNIAIFATVQIENAVGGAGNDTILGNGLANTLWGNAGNDTLRGGMGADLLYGDDGEDLVFGENGDDILVGGSGNDLLEGGDGSDVMYGLSGANNLVGGSGNDTYIVDSDTDIIAESFGVDFGGFDTLYSRVASMLVPLNVEVAWTWNDAVARNLTGNEQNNVLLGSPGANVFSGEGGNDVLYGYGGSDDLNGGAGNDIISGGGSDDILNGASGDDWLDGGEGADLMSGGAGNDSFVVDHFEDTPIDGPGQGFDTIYSGISFVLPDNFEQLVLTGSSAISGVGNGLDNGIIGNDVDNNLSGLNGNDFIYGRGGRDYIDGGLGDDVLVGEGGDDELVGGEGRDFLYGGGARNVLVGGAGNDVYIVESPSDLIMELSEEGWDTVYASVDFSLHSEVEVLILTGTGSLRGLGNSLNNTLFGNAGDNDIDGAAGDDYVFGANGNDRLTGGAGNDVFRFDFAVGDGINVDTIIDFEDGRDKIDLRAVPYTAGGVTQFAQLIISDEGTVWRITVSGNTEDVLFVSKSNVALDAEDFYFAAT